jgi:tetratricopeptide (TPR) repeat protein
MGWQAVAPPWANLRIARRATAVSHLGVLLRGFVLTLGLASHTLALPQRPAAEQPGSPEIGNALLETAQAALNRHDYVNAATALKQVVAQDPHSVSGWFNLGYAYSGLGQNDAAVRAYQRAIELDPNLFEARMNLGILLLEAQHPNQALEQLQRAVALKPDRARAHLYYARALWLDGKDGEALAELREALRLDPSLAIAHYDMGQLALSRKQFAEARASFEQAVKLDPHLAQARLGLARAAEGLQDTAGAVNALRAYLEVQPRDQEARFHLARLYLQQGMNEEALSTLEQIYQANPKLPGLAAALGDVHALLKHYAESERFYREALAEAPPNRSPWEESDLRRALGQTLLDEHAQLEAAGKADQAATKLASAEKEFRHALQLDPHNAEAAKGLASSLYLEKGYAEAVPIIEGLVRTGNAPPGVYFVLATCYDHLRDRPRALEAYEKFLSLAPDRNSDQVWQAEQRAKLLRRELHRQR